MRDDPAPVWNLATVLIREGESSDALWFITRGQASVQLTTDDGTHLRVSGVRAGTTVGQIGFIDGQARSASVVAETAVEAMRLGNTAFQQLADEHPELVQSCFQLSIDLATHLRSESACLGTGASGHGVVTCATSPIPLHLFGMSPNGWGRQGV